MKPRIVIEKDKSGYYVAEVPAMPGCLSQGRTRREALANIKEAMTAWRATRKAHFVAEMRHIRHNEDLAGKGKDLGAVLKRAKEAINRKERKDRKGRIG